LGIQGSYGHGKPGKVMEFKKWLFPGLEKSLKKMLSQKFWEKVMDMCHKYMFIYTV